MKLYCNFCETYTATFRVRWPDTEIKYYACFECALKDMKAGAFIEEFVHEREFGKEGERCSGS